MPSEPTSFVRSANISCCLQSQQNCIITVQTNYFPRKYKLMIIKFIWSLLEKHLHCGGGKSGYLKVENVWLNCCIFVGTNILARIMDKLCSK